MINNAMTRDFAPVDVVIAGGGIGGLANAFALRRQGLSVRVLERSAQFGEVGAGLQMAPNATRVLDSWGLLGQAIARGVLPERMLMHDAVDGARLTSLDLTDLGNRYGAPYLVIHRSDLLDILLEACRDAGVELVTNAQVTTVDPHSDHAVASTAAGQHRGAVVLAADGLKSRLRRHFSEDEPVSSGYVAYRGAVPVADIDTSGLSLRDVVVYVGPDCHLVQYALRRGEIFNQVAVFRSPKAVRGETEWGTPDELDAAFSATCETVRLRLDRLWRDRWWQMYDRSPIDRWVDGRLALTGDAAHPMLQYLAQGACQALEDADCLASELRARSGDWDATLREYQDARTVRTARVQSSARVWGEMWHCTGMFRSVRNAMLTGRAVDDYQYIDWLYGAQPVGDRLTVGGRPIDPSAELMQSVAG